ncbi:hypothetical protein [Streptomyces sp. YIM 98790]|uniref:hypothetical protein n=1 Tax=Streptomyces sp. YIM 98790 TaxID=2689077 RepID=UPI001A9E867D|nr:hypothetical protein [Streptomyces sp. YIM 98790]
MGDPELRAMRAAARRGDWPALRERLAAVPDGAERGWILSALARVKGTETWLPRVAAEDPEPALALLLAGARQVRHAWEARTGARAALVSQEQFRVFHERLRVAEELLFDAAEREPDWADPWLFLVPCGRGLQVGPEQARYRFEAAVRRAPGHPEAHRQRLQGLCRKWYGSHEEMHAFARDSMLAAPEGSPLGELVALAHLEHALDTRWPMQGHLRAPTVVRELREAAERSVLHPAFGRPRDAVQSLNTFAMALAVAGQKAAARRVFSAIRGVVTEFPWKYLPRREFQTNASLFFAWQLRCAVGR